MKIILFQLGSLIVYYKAQSSYIPYSFGDNNLYWRDNTNPDGFGPFNTLYGVMKHYEAVIEDRRVAKLPQPQPELIRVDFKNKKRLDP